MALQTESDDPTTPLEVEREMITINRHIMNAPKTIREYHDKLKDARAVHRRAYNLAYLRAEGTAAERKATAELETEAEATALAVAEVEYTFLRDTLDALKTKLRGLQSISSLMKASMFTPQGGI